MLSYCSVLSAFVWLFAASESNACHAPEYISHEGVVFTPNKVHISNGDQAIVQCVVEFYQENPPQTFMYVNDCKMMGFNHPYWITKIMQIDAPCSYTDSSKLCRTLTMYINGTEEAHNSRVYCCARIGGRVCSPNSTISVVEAPQPSLTEPTDLPTESCRYPPKPTISSSNGPAQTPASTPLNTSPDNQPPTTSTVISYPTDFEFSDGSHNLACTLSLLLSLLANTLLMLSL